MTTLPLGSNTIAAAYSGGGNFAASTGTLTQNVTALTTSTLTVSPPNEQTVGQPVMLTCTVTSASGTPQGFVSFLDGSTTLAADVPLVGGVADITESDFALGSHSFSCAYDGGTDFRPSTSAMVPYTIVNHPSTTTLTQSSPTSAQGESVTFTATVAAVAMGLSTPTGTVSFFADGSTTPITGCSSVPLSGTPPAASCVDSTLAPGTHTIVADYSGDGNFATSTSNTVSHVVTAAVPGLRLTKTAECPPPNQCTSVSAAGDQITYTYTLDNTGNVVISGVTVTDENPPGSTPTTICTVATLPVSGTTTCSSVYTVTSANVTAGEVLDTASASGTAVTGTVNSNPFSVSVDVRPTQPPLTSIVVNTNNTIGVSP